jgi:hypothetical protein
MQWALLPLLMSLLIGCNDTADDSSTPTSNWVGNDEVEFPVYIGNFRGYDEIDENGCTLSHVGFEDPNEWTVSDYDIPETKARGDSVPIELTEFTAQETESGTVMLSWVTISESEMWGYRLLRSESSDLNSAYCVSEMILATNSSEGDSYQYTDCYVAAETTYYYWVEAISIYDATQLFGPATITTGSGEPPAPFLINDLFAYPNPSYIWTIRVTVADSTTAHLALIDKRGSILQDVAEIGVAGAHAFIVNGHDLGLSDGLYRIFAWFEGPDGCKYAYGDLQYESYSRSATWDRRSVNHLKPSAPSR